MIISYLHLQVIGDSGCDNFKKLLVQYKKDSGQWQDKPIAGVTETQMTIDNIQSGYYSIRLSVTNNEDIESFSDTTTLTVGRKYDTYLVTTVVRYSTCFVDGAVNVHIVS